MVSTIPSPPPPPSITSGKAGNVKHCLQAWGAITSDLFILAIIEFGVTLDFIGLPPENSPTVTVFPSVTLPGIAEELLNLGRNEVFIPTIWTSGSFISPIFTTKKSDGSPQLILNLKKLNCYIRYVHFKVESLGDVLNIIKPGVWMASVDLQDAYYTIPVHPDHQKYLTFSWQHKYYKFTCLPNGYAQAPMIFTKLLKHPFSFLRRRGHHSIIYIDDAYLQGDSYDACYNNVYETASLIQKLGFTINLRKSVLHPTQQVEFLGFILDSRLMTIKLSRRRIDGIISACTMLLQGHSLRMQYVASVVGMLIAALPAVRHGALFYRAIERDKNAALRRNKGNFRKMMTLSVAAKNDILWWHNHIGSAHHFVHPPPLP